MTKRWYILFVLLVIVSTASITLTARSDSDELIREDDHLWEEVAVYRFNGDLNVSNIPDIDSLSALANYWWASDGRVNTLKPNEKDSIQALVTFRADLSLVSVEEILADFEIVRLRFVDDLDGGGQMPYPIDMALVSKVEAAAAEAGIGNGPFFTGFTAAQIIGERRKVRDLEKSEDVFLVEIGPVEYLEEFSDAKITSFDDVAYEYEKYIIPVCNIDQLRTLLINKDNAGLIDDPGVFNSFLVKVDEAATKINKGQNKVARNVLLAFINEGHAQAGKHVEETAAGELIIVAECVRYSLAD